MKATRLTLVCHALTESQRLGRFHKDDDPLRAESLPDGQLTADSGCMLLTAPETRAQQTLALYERPFYVVSELRDCDFDEWRGMDLKRVQTADPAGLSRWLSDPDAAPHGGESVTQLCSRVATWMDALETPGYWLAVTHPFVIRAAVIHALRCPADVFHRIDVLPLSTVELSFAGMWRLRIS